MGCLKLKYFSDETLSEIGGLLGSGTWITYTDGSAIQHLHYLPGEEQIDQRLTSFNSRYTFSAKEKDIETGYSYFGARYYDSDLSIWLSVDPMSDKYPSLSPYNYCANNPIILMDPNGEDVTLSGESMFDFFNEVKIGAKAMGIKVKMNKDGVLSAKYTGKGKISEDGQKFLDAVNSKTVSVNVNCLNSGTDETMFMFGGEFGGNEILGETIDGRFVGQFATAFQTVIPSELKAMDDFYGKPGQSSIHEITEAFMGAKIAMEKGKSSIGTGKGSYAYKEAHESAVPQSGIITRFFYDKNKNPLLWPNVDNARWIDFNAGVGTPREKVLKTTTVY